MTISPRPTGRCLLCQVDVYDQAALCPQCEANLEDDDTPVSPAQLDALVSVNGFRQSHRAQRQRRGRR